MLGGDRQRWLEWGTRPAGVYGFWATGPEAVSLR